ncbi:MAG: carboxymuconolactone decarboxylase family protein [Chlamydiae bacterium]|nr:carboxymuconolactone decarboxylase family protein [Chlamydiota bacterium]
MEQKISNAFLTFQKESPKHAQAWSELVKNLSKANALDPKTTALAYLSILAVLGLESGIPFHVQEAKLAKATKEEVISAILLGLPAAGNKVIQALPIALKAYDER